MAIDIKKFAQIQSRSADVVDCPVALSHPLIFRNGRFAT
jgi:hypothetical protein